MRMSYVLRPEPQQSRDDRLPKMRRRYALDGAPFGAIAGDVIRDAAGIAAGTAVRRFKRAGVAHPAVTAAAVQEVAQLAQHSARTITDRAIRYIVHHSTPRRRLSSTPLDML